MVRRHQTMHDEETAPLAEVQSIVSFNRWQNSHIVTCGRKLSISSFLRCGEGERSTIVTTFWEKSTLPYRQQRSRSWRPTPCLLHNAIESGHHGLLGTQVKICREWATHLVEPTGTFQFKINETTRSCVPRRNFEWFPNSASDWTGHCSRN